jgi:hypothetical protein
MKHFLAIALLALPAPAFAQQVGDTVQILRSFQTEEHDNRGSNGTTSDTDGMTERVVAMRDGGLELEYDITNEGDRSSSWQFPARVFKPAHGPLKLVNAAELESRVDGWLKSGGMTRAACGHWIFTWNAFRIECDPQTVLHTIQALQIEPEELREGAAFTLPEARAPAPLVKKSERRYTAALTLDPERVRKQRADNDIAIAELNRTPLTPDAARRNHAGEIISGTIGVTFDLNADGHVQRRTIVTKQEIRSKDGRVETTVATEVLERRTAPRPPRDPNLI